MLYYVRNMTFVYFISYCIYMKDIGIINILIPY